MHTLCVPEKTGRVSSTDDWWKQRFQEILDAYASAVAKLSDEAVITMHREHLSRHAADLAAITRKELDWRRLIID